MRFLTFFSLLLALALCLPAIGLKAAYLGDIYVDPLGLVPPFDGATLGFEYAIPRNQSLKLQGRLSGRGDYPVPADDRSVAGIEAGWRLYFGDHSMRGFFLGPQIGAALQTDTYSITDSSGKHAITATGTYLKAGLEFGHQWIFSRGFVLTPAVVGSFIPAYSVGTGRSPETGRIYAGIELNLGYAFER